MPPTSVTRREFIATSGRTTATLAAASGAIAAPRIARSQGASEQVVLALIDQDKGYFPDKWHQPNFVQSIRTREQPNASIEKVHPSACLVHLANTSYRVGQKQLHFDGATERFTNSDEANRLLKPAYRKQYRIPDEV